MSNRLTPALLAAAITAVVNILTGTDAVSWNIFLAAAVAMVFGLDLSNSKISEGSPAGHSLAAAFAALYIGGICAYAAIVYLLCSECTAVQALAGIGAGALSHVLAELLTGRTVFTFPRNMKTETWFWDTGPGYDRFWSGWGRISFGRHLGDAHLNALSVSVLLACIWLGPTA